MPVECLQWLSATGRVAAKLFEISRIAVHGERRSPPLDAQMIEPRVHQRGRRKRGLRFGRRHDSCLRDHPRVRWTTHVDSASRAPSASWTA